MIENNFSKVEALPDVVDTGERLNISSVDNMPNQRYVPSRSFSETLQATWDNSWLGAALQENTNYEQQNLFAPFGQKKPIEAGFNKWDAFKKAGYDPSWFDEYQDGVYSNSDLAAFDQKYSRVTNTKRVLAESGALGVVGELASQTALDPIFWATMGIGTGVKTVSGLATLGAAEAGASEIMQRDVDPSRTIEESAINVAAGTVLGAMLGGGVKTFESLASRGAIKSSPVDFKQFAEKVVKSGADVNYHDLSAGAMMAKSNHNFAVGGTKLGKKLAKATSYLSPANMIARVESPESQKLLSAIYTPSYVTAGDIAGVARPTRTVVNETRHFEQNAIVHAGEYHDMRALGLKAAADEGKTVPEFSFDDRTYMLATSENSVAQLEDLAKTTSSAYEKSLYQAAAHRKKYYEDLFEQAKADGVDSLRKLDNYQPFVESMRKIDADATGFRGALVKHFKDYSDEVKAKFDVMMADFKNRYDAHYDAILRSGADKRLIDEEILRLDKEYAKKIKETERMRDIREDELAGEADREFSRIVHGDAYQQVSEIDEDMLPRFFNKRKYNQVDFLPWLETDHVQLSTLYAKKVAPKIANKRILGTESGDKAIEAYIEKMDIATAKARDAGDLVAAKKIVDEKNMVVKQVTDSMKQNEGMLYNDFYKDWPRLASFIAGAQAWGTVAMQGNGLMANLAEAGALFLTHNIVETMPVALDVLRKFKSSPEFKNLTAQQLKETGQALEWTLNKMVGDTIAEAGNIGDQFVKGNRTFQGIYKNFFRYNGQVFFEQGVREVSTLTGQTMIYRGIKKLVAGKADASLTTRLAKLGIDSNNAKSLLTDMELNKVTQDGFDFFLPSKMSQSNGSLWRTAVDTNIRTTHFNYATGDVAQSLAHPAVALLAKFKKWPIMATQNYLVPSVQLADATAMSGIASLVGIASITNMAAIAATGGDIPDDPIDIIYGGIERSGVLGLAHDFGLNQVAAAAGIQGGGAKYAEYQTLMTTLLGANGTMLTRIGEAADLMPMGESADARSVRNLLKLMPFSNAPVVSQTIDAATIN